MLLKDILDILFCLNLTIMIQYILINIIYSFQLSHTYNFENIPIIDEIEQSLNSRIIINFRKAPICNKNEEELIIDQFEPIENCSCHRIILPSKCPNQKGCISMEIPARNYTKINSNKFCVIKSKKYSELLEDNNIILKNEKCPKNYKYCGIIDSLERKLCIKKENNCPLTISDISNNIKGENKDIIIYKFKLDQKYPCIDLTQRNWNFHGHLKSLDKKCTHKIKHQLFNYEYNKLNITTSQYDLYKDNDILDYIKKYDSNKSDLEKEEIFLFGRNFIGVERSKAKNFSKKILIDNQNTLNRCLKAMEILTYFLTISMFFCGNCGQYIVALLLILFFPISIAYFIVCCIIYTKHCLVKSILDIKSDIYTNELIELLMKETLTNYYFSLITINIFPFIIFIDFVIFVLKKFFQ